MLGRLRILSWVITLATLGACGGGGGSGPISAPSIQTPPPSASPPPSGPPGTVEVSVVDLLGEPLPFARVDLDSSAASREATADSNGNLTFADVAPGPVSVFAVFTDDTGSYSLGVAGQAQLSPGGHVTLRVEARPLADPVIGLAGGFVDPGGVSSNGRVLTFRVLMIYVDGNRYIDHISSGPTTVGLSDCVPDTTNDAPEFRADCVEGSAGFDAPFHVVDPTQSVEFDRVEFAATPSAYTASLLLDQSEHIASNDPWDLRLLGVKYAVAQTQPTDVMTLAAFAADDLDSGRLALLPQRPVTMVSTASIDELATLEGGAAPLYAAIESELDRIAPTPAPHRMVAVLTDGYDDTCGTPTECDAARHALAEKSLDTSVEIVTIAIGADKDGRALSKLTAESRGRTFRAQEPDQIRLLLAALPELLSKYGRGIDLNFRIQASAPGVFRSGRTVFATLNFEECPFECNGGSIPLAIPIP